MHWLFGRKRSSGFTLVEMLVVISVISVLSLVAFMSYGEARKNVRDKERLANVKQLQTAIEVYGNTNGRYPEAGCSVGSWSNYAGSGSGSGSVQHCTTYISDIEELMDPLPVDPVNTTTGYIYATNAAGTEYKIMSHNSLENVTMSEGQEHARCASSCAAAYCQDTDSSFTKSYAAYSSGAACW